MMSRKLLRATLWCVLALLLGSAAVMAQTGTSITGNTLDPQGAVVPGVTVTLTNKATGVTRTAISNESGTYSFAQLAAGNYTLKAELQGFKTVVASDVDVLVSTVLKVDLKFTEVGGIAETVTVKGTAALINTSDATLGNAFTETQVRELPLEGRNVVGLLSLQPGVTFIGEGNDYRNGAVNGGKSDQANVTLDGTDVNDQQNGFAFTSVLRVTLDSVQEFRVTTAGLNADQGRSSGAQITLVTRQGSNTLHGAAYEYHRNTATTANDYFLKRSQLSTGKPNLPPKLLRNVFGATLGGPLWKDRLFIFGNYEGRRDAKESSVSRTVPSADLRNGILKYRNTAGGITTLQPADVKNVDPAKIGVNQASLDVFKQFPLPNDTSVGDGLNLSGYRFASPTPFKYNDYVSRIDYNITRDARHAVFIRGNLQNDKGNGAQNLPGQPPATVNLTNSKGLATNYKALLSPRLVNSFTYGYTRQGNESSAAAELKGATTFRSLSNLFDLTRGSGRIIPVHNIADDLSWQKGSHSLQFGGNLRWIRNGSFTFGNSFPSASTNSSWLLGTGNGLSSPLTDLSSTFRTSYRDAMMALLGIVSQGNARYNYDRTGKPSAVGSAVRRSFGANEYEMYAQDSWKVKSNLTLTFGLRYGLYSPPWETNGNQVSPDISLGGWFDLRGTNMQKGIASNAAPKIKIDLAGPANGKKGFYNWDKNNFSPRFAFAWSPSTDGFLKKLTGGPGNFVVRGGFSVAFDRIGAGLASTFDSGGSFGLSTALTNASSSLTEITAPRFTGFYNIPSTLLLPAPAGGFPQTPPSVFAITSSMDDTIRTPYHMLTNFSIQRQLPHGFSFEATYVGRLARKILVNDDLAMPINLKDSASGTDYFTAATQLAKGVFANTPTASIGKIAFWENVFPGLATSSLSATQVAYNVYKDYSPDFTSALYDLDVGCDPACSKFGRYSFFNDQYSALAAWRSRGWINYHAAQFLIRKRFAAGTQFDLNYTFSKTLDLSSVVERNGSYAGFTVNAWSPGMRKSVSDYDSSHALNANWIAELPLGRGKWLFKNSNSFVNQFIGGWQVSGIFRWTSGFPTSVGEGRFWPTNWNITGFATRIDQIPVTDGGRSVKSLSGTSSGPNLFSDPAAALKAYRFTYPGDVGTRNDVRGDGFYNTDLGVAKFWKLPIEGHRVAFRWETFNLSNSVRFDPQSATLDLGSGASSFGNLSGTLTNSRVMQFALRYEF